jgi:flagella basal body P-ring formation protein FlgA
MISRLHKDWRRAAAALAAFSVLVLSGPAWSQQPEPGAAGVSLRQPVQASGPALRLGDVLTVEGPAADREIAPAPRAGRSSAYPVAVLAAAAKAAGVDWTPPAGLESIEVLGPEVNARGSAAASSAQVSAPAAAVRTRAEPVIKRGDVITLHYDAGPLRLSARARALANAAAGDPVRLVNIDSERAIDAIAVAPGQARVSTP